MGSELLFDMDSHLKLMEALVSVISRQIDDKFK